MQKRKPRTENQVMYGNEPIVNDPTKLQLIRLLNWYSNVGQPNDRINWTVHWAKANNHSSPADLSVLTKEAANLCPTWAALCRAENVGSKLGDDCHARLVDAINKFIERYQATVQNDKSANVRNAERMRAMVHKMNEQAAGVLDAQVDLLFQRREPTITKLDAKQVASPAFKSALKRLRGQASEWIAARNGDDEYLNESYPGMRSVLKNAIHWVENLTNQVIANKALNPVVRNTRHTSRVRKQPGADLKFANQSKATSELIGAGLVWLYNERDRRAARVESADDDGLRAKGASIINVKTTTIKTIRKPDKFLAAVARSGLKTIDDLFEHIHAKPVVKIGKFRTGSQWRLVRVF